MKLVDFDADSEADVALAIVRTGRVFGAGAAAAWG